MKQLYDDDEQFVVLYYVNTQNVYVGITSLGETYESRPTPIGDYSLHYVKDENKCLWDVPEEGFIECSFPIANVARSSSVGFVKINQTFDGFGYIGSTVFALPGIKGLIPNGRNADGTLKTIEFVTSKVSTIQVVTGATAFGIKGETGDYIVGIFGDDVYDDALNIMSYQGIVYPWMICGNLIFSNNTITSFAPKTTFHAVDRNDISWLSGLGMPSNRYIDLILGASDSAYTAPANGWVYIAKTSGGSSQYLTVYSQGLNSSNILEDYNVVSLNVQNLTILFPVKKNQVFTIGYNATGRTNFFRFIYAEGEQ